MLRRAFCVGVALAVLGGCGVSRSSTDKLLDAAHEHNGAVRFGRMDIAMEHVAQPMKTEWLRRRAEWKNGVRIVDVELDGLQFEKAGEASVRVRLSWQRIDEAELRSTELVQKWETKSGVWQLVTEECAGGDESLLAKVGAQ